ncbi:MAG: 5'-nucleotidase C-terminal domain-containing protein [Treponema sp.]|nr:5'-nucleotidase C-terminal domain-containing protein [Treponema sp.]
MATRGKEAESSQTQKSPLPAGSLDADLTSEVQKISFSAGIWDSSSDLYILPVIETSDIHGNIIFEKNEQIHYRLSYIADKVKDIRGYSSAYDAKKLLLLDGGDIYQGNIFSNLEKGKCMYMALDLMDYDAVALGNHEFDWGFENMVEKDSTLPAYKMGLKKFPNQVPVLALNLYQNQNKVADGASRGKIVLNRPAKDYVILEKKAINQKGQEIAVRIAVVGYVCDYSRSILASEFGEKGFKIKSSLEPANNLAYELEFKGLCDASLLLMHADAQERAEKLGEDSVFDLVLGGHSHRKNCGKTSWGLTYLQPSAHATSYCYSQLAFKKEESGKVIFCGTLQDQVISVDDSKNTAARPEENKEDLDDEILELSKQTLARTNLVRQKKFGVIKENVTKNPLKMSGGRACLKANWMCDIIRRVADADIAFQNSGGVRAGNFTLDEKGQCQITINDLYNLFPFENRIYVYKLTYQELLTLFDYAMTSSGSGLFYYQTGIFCHYAENSGAKGNNDSKGKNTGNNYYVKELKKDGITIYKDGQWLEGWKNKYVRVAVNEFSASNNRPDSVSGMSNPCLEWNKGEKLVEADKIDREGAEKVLKEEAKKNSGLLRVEDRSYFILEN